MTFAAGQIVTADDLNAVAEPPLAVLRRTSDQTITTATDTTVTWQAADVDTHTGWDSGTNPSRYTAQVEGYYEIVARIHYEANTTGVRQAWLWLNGASILATRDTRAPATAVGWPVATSAIVAMSVGDYIQVRTAQTSGGDLDVSSGTNHVASALHVRYVRPL